MIIIKTIKHSDKLYTAITDDTRVVASLLKGESISQDEHPIELDSLLLVRCKQNATFVERLQDSIKDTSSRQIHIIESTQLIKILLGNAMQEQMRIVGITGTNGKTTTAAIIYSILLDLGYKVALLGTRGFFMNDKMIKPKGLTTPSLLELYENLCIAREAKSDFFIMEVSSHAIEQERIAGLEFALKILSNITSDHLDYHKSIEEYRRIKNSFFEGSGAKLINADEPYAHCSDKTAFYYGIEKKGHLSVDAYALENGIDAHISWRGHNGDVEHSTIEAHLYGKHNLYNALAAVGAVKILTSKGLESIAQALGHFGGVSGRMEVVHTSPLVIVDFAHTYDGMRQIFESFRHQKIVVVFGAGGDRDKTKRPKMGECAQQFAHKIYVTSDNPRTESAQSIIEDILSGITRQERVFVEVERKNAICRALDELQNDEVLLILGKGDEDYQIIGTQKLHFDDREIVKAYFAHKHS